jgi:hypothetical protein
LKVYNPIYFYPHPPSTKKKTRVKLNKHTDETPFNPFVVVRNPGSMMGDERASEIFLRFGVVSSEKSKVPIRRVCCERGRGEGQGDRRAFPHEGVGEHVCPIYLFTTRVERRTSPGNERKKTSHQEAERERVVRVPRPLLIRSRSRL